MYGQHLHEIIWACWASLKLVDITVAHILYAHPVGRGVHLGVIILWQLLSVGLVDARLLLVVHAGRVAWQMVRMRMI